MDTSFLKHASVYGLAHLLVRAAGVILLPIYLRSLTPADYGILDVVERMAETVGTCLLFGGFRQALLTFYSQADNENHRRQVVSTTLTLLLIASVFGGLLAQQISQGLIQLLASLLQSEAPAVGNGLLRLAILSIMLEPFSLIPMTLFQARLQSSTYILIALAQVLFRISLCIVLVRVFNWGVAGVLLASVVYGLVFGLVLCGWELLRGATWPSWDQARQMLNFALPMLPGGLCFFFLHQGDRFFLMHYCPMAEVGTYGLGYKLALVVTMFSLNPLYMVWSARMYTEARRPDAPRVFGRTFTRILSAYLFLGLGLCVFSDEVVTLLGGAPYARASRVIAPVVLACFFQAAAALMDAGYYVRHRTGAKLAITLAATAVTLLLYCLWIPAYGSMGAALATLGGFAFLAVITWWSTQRIFPVHYEWGRLLALLGLAIGLWLVSDLLSPHLWMIPAKVGLLILALLIPWYTGLVSEDEKSDVRGIASYVWWTLRRLGQGLPSTSGECWGGDIIPEGSERPRTVLVIEDDPPTVEEQGAASLPS
jgi:O-antigen/teichoic acid export membrane protein